jgi:hypothetical protein
MHTRGTGVVEQRVSRESNKHRTKWRHKGTRESNMHRTDAQEWWQMGTRASNMHDTAHSPPPRGCCTRHLDTVRHGHQLGPHHKRRAQHLRQLRTL